MLERNYDVKVLKFLWESLHLGGVLLPCNHWERMDIAFLIQQKNDHSLFAHMWENEAICLNQVTLSFYSFVLMECCKGTLIFSGSLKKTPLFLPWSPGLFTLRRQYPQISVKAFGLSFLLTSLTSLCRHEWGAFGWFKWSRQCRDLQWQRHRPKEFPRHD